MRAILLYHHLTIAKVMKRNTILAALTAVSLSAAVTPVGAQQLLPQPKQAVFGKGTFNPQKGIHPRDSQIIPMTINGIQ